MYKLLLKILEKLACKHKWLLHQKNNIFEDSSDKYPTIIKDTLICSECGKIKKITL